MSLTKILHESYLRTVCESESLNEDSKYKLIEEDFDIIDATINGLLIIHNFFKKFINNHLF